MATLKLYYIEDSDMFFKDGYNPWQNYKLRVAESLKPDDLKDKTSRSASKNNRNQPSVCRFSQARLGWPLSSSRDNIATRFPIRLHQTPQVCETCGVSPQQACGVFTAGAILSPAAASKAHRHPASQACAPTGAAH